MIEVKRNILNAIRLYFEPLTPAYWKRTVTAWRMIQWRIMAKHNKRAIYLAALAIALAIGLILWLEHMEEHILRLKRENEVQDLLIQHYDLTKFGAPGTQTDFKEGTEEMDK